MMMIQTQTEQVGMVNTDGLSSHNFQVWPNRCVSCNLHATLSSQICAPKVCFLGGEEEEVVPSAPFPRREVLSLTLE